MRAVLSEQADVYLGIDLGGTKVAMRLEGDDGYLHQHTFQWPSSQDADAEHDLAALTGSVRTLMRQCGRPVRAVGVAVPATFDKVGRVTAWPTRPTWAGLELGPALRSVFRRTPVRWADDGDLAALAEARSQACGNLVYIGVGTGVGGGIVLDGRSCPGFSRGSCEIGHMVVDLSGPWCDCGRRGCLQAVASGPATLRRATELRGSAAAAGPGQVSAAAAGPGQFSEVTFAELKSALAGRTEWAQTAVEVTCAALACSAVSLQELVRPSLVCIGGGFAAGLPGFVDAVSRHARGLTRPGHPPVAVKAAALHGLSSLHGAIALARDRELTTTDSERR